MDSTGEIYICATPIGNLEDITLRALKTLRQVDLIACEDTRRTRRLLDRFNIHTRTISYHEHNERSRVKQLVQLAKQGKRIAVVSDAGTPGIADPGFTLVRAAVAEGIKVSVLPGPSALVAALSVSGLPTDRFTFYGFLPRDRLERRRVLTELGSRPETLIVYEAPHRLRDTAHDLADLMAERTVIVARELTKHHEGVLRTTAVALPEKVAELERKGSLKGEFTLVVEGGATAVNSRASLDIRRHVQYFEDLGLDRKQAMKAVAKERGMSKRDIYKALQEISK